MDFSGEVHKLVDESGQAAEAQLVARAGRGDSAAWLGLVTQYQEAVFRLAYLILRDADEAEDVAQETFVRAFRSLERFDSGRPLRPWLLTIAANLARNRRRAIGRYLAAARRLLERTPLPAVTGNPHGGENTLDRQWQAEALGQAVQRLNPAGQEIIYLRYFMELSEAETAAVLNVAPGTVKSRSHRALQRLRVIIETNFPALREAFGGD